jgi:hypothetical protein
MRDVEPDAVGEVVRLVVVVRLVATKSFALHGEDVDDANDEGDDGDRPEAEQETSRC